ncbi:GTP-binding protein, partial [Stigmatella aurantiaca DW4/3-1]
AFTSKNSCAPPRARRKPVMTSSCTISTSFAVHAARNWCMNSRLRQRLNGMEISTAASCLAFSAMLASSAVSSCGVKSGMRIVYWDITAGTPGVPTMK